MAITNKELANSISAQTLKTLGEHLSINDTLNQAIVGKLGGVVTGAITGRYDQVMSEAVSEMTGMPAWYDRCPGWARRMYDEALAVLAPLGGIAASVDPLWIKVPFREHNPVYIQVQPQVKQQRAFYLMKVPWLDGINRSDDPDVETARYFTLEHLLSDLIPVLEAENGGNKMG